MQIIKGTVFSSSGEVEINLRTGEVLDYNLTEGKLHIVPVHVETLGQEQDNDEFDILTVAVWWMDMAASVGECVEREAPGCDFPGCNGRNHMEHPRPVPPTADEPAWVAIMEGVIQRFETEYQELTDGEFGTVEGFPEVQRARRVIKARRKITSNKVGRK